MYTKFQPYFGSFFMTFSKIGCGTKLHTFFVRTHRTVRTNMSTCILQRVRQHNFLVSRKLSVSRLICTSDIECHLCAHCVHNSWLCTVACKNYGHSLASQFQVWIPKDEQSLKKVFHSYFLENFIKFSRIKFCWFSNF